MLVYEYKVDATKVQYARMEEAIRVGQFVRNKCLRLWMDGIGVSANDLQVYCSQLAKDFPFVACLNSQARQSAAGRTWQAINRFYQNCREMKPGKKGYPRFRHHCRSVEYKQTGWKLEPDGRHLTFTDGCGIGRVRLLGTREVTSFPTSQIKRVRLLRRADGYYVQFAVAVERRVEHVVTGRAVGIDVGLMSFYTDSNGRSIINPRYLRNSERRLRVLSQRFSRKNTSSLGAKKPKVNHAARHRAKHNKYPPQQMSYATTAGTTPAPTPFSPDTPPPGNGMKRRSHSAKWQRARIALARKHLKVQRQREDFARKQASALVSSHDLIALEDLQVRNLVKNRRLAKSISDVGWARFRHWVEYYGKLHGIPVIAVPPQSTSQYCSQCNRLVAKSLSMRTHVCPTCGLILDRDHNAARNILARALASHSAPAQQLRTVGHTET